MLFDPSNGRTQVFSHGGGVQGTGICALIVSGELPKPDIAVIADTGRESSKTWQYFESVTRPALEGMGIPVHRIPHSFAGDGYNTVDLFSGKDGKTIVMPMFTNKSGKVGMLPKYCSNEWKRRPIERFLRAQGIHEADMWIGFSVDEAATRARLNPEAKFRDVYPLIELGLSRQDARQKAIDMGWPPPSGSACWQCPYRSNREWVEQITESPEDQEAAVKLERYLRRRDENVFFHRSCKPLDQIDFESEPDTEYQAGCQSGLCFT